MTLHNIIKKETEVLFKRLTDLEKQQEKITNDDLETKILEIEEILDKIEKDKSSLRHIDITELENIFKGSIEDVPTDFAEFSKDFKELQIVLKGIYDAHLNIDLTTKQELFLKKLLERLNFLKEHLNIKIAKINNLKEKNKEQISTLEDQVLELVILNDKIVDTKDNSVLEPKDFHLFYDTIINSKLSDDEKINALVLFKKYNDERKNHINKETVDLNALVELFKEFNLSEEFLNLFLLKEKEEDKYKENTQRELLENADINNIREILTYLQEESPNKKNILHKFSPATLLAICTYGELEYIKDQYNQIENNGDLDGIVYNNASAWVRNFTKEIKRKKRKSSIIDEPVNKKGIKNPIIHQTHKNSYNEMLENKKFLEDKGFKLAVDEKGNNSVLIYTPPSLLQHNYEIFKNYGVFDERQPKDFPISYLSKSIVDDKCDRCIELELFHPLHEQEAFNKNYLPKVPGIIQKSENYYICLYKLLQSLPIEEYNATIASTQCPGYIKGEIDQVKSLSNLETRKRYLQENFINQSEAKYIPNYKQYSEALLTVNCSNLDKRILNLDILRNLEENYRVENNEYVYAIGNRPISRYKVIRYCNALQEANIEIAPESLIYVITKDSYINEETFNTIAQCISYTYGQGEDKNELSKKI